MSKNYNLELQSNNTDLQEILNIINALPEESGGGSIDLPSLTNEGIASDLLSGKELINSNGGKVTGTMKNNGDIASTMNGIDTKSVSIPAGYTSGGTVSLDDTIDNEVATQADLITQIMETLSAKSAYNTIYIGSSEPTSDIGVDGDIYIVRSGD